MLLPGSYRMEIKGEYKIAAPREKVFAALNDQAVLQACIPAANPWRRPRIPK